ncbi:MAG TPA: sulfite exporter TauE/SafE family protein [Desulfomonilaceae bacterium]|nr:sulfite exporter TauE/SafE family protein [Desulfomonilaceae bacterium]
MIWIVMTYAAVGAVAGILAGLLGVGGGLVIVPMLVYCFAAQGVSYDQIMHLALGTSLSSIMFTSMSSFMAHHRRGAVRWDIVRGVALGIVMGTFLGSCIAAQLSTAFLSIFFVVFLYYCAVQMILDRKPNPSRQLPGKFGMFGVGNLIGAVSSFVGIGGGTLSVPFMVWCNIPVHHAIGTSAAIGFPIAVAGTVGYVYSGLHAPNLPDYSLGYMYVPGLLGIVCSSVLTAPLGVWIAHRLPVRKLKQVFAVLLGIMGTRMLYGLL